MAFGDFSTDSIRAKKTTAYSFGQNTTNNSVKNLFGTFGSMSPKESKPTAYTLENLTPSKSLFPFGKLNLTGNNSVQNTTSVLRTDASSISIEKKEAAKADFLENYLKDFHELSPNDQTAIRNLILKKFNELEQINDNNSTNTQNKLTQNKTDNNLDENKQVQIDSLEFQSFSPDAQKFLHKQFRRMTKVKTENIPPNQKVKLEPIEELKD